MAELEQGLEELKVVKQAFKDNISANNVSTSNVEFRNMPDLLKQMEKKLPSQTKSVEPTKYPQIVKADDGYKLEAVGVREIPSQYIIPSGTKEITENNEYDVTEFAKIKVAVEGTGTGVSGNPKFSQLIDGSIQTIEQADLTEPNSIKDYTFYGCKNLTSVIVPSNVKTIGANAFKYCSSLQSLILADEIQSIGANAFDGINASEIEIPNTVSLLESEVFANNTALTSITIPSGITELKDNVFNGCTSLTEVTMNGLIPPVVDDTTFPSTVVAIKVPYGAYESYLEQWSTYTDKIVRLPAIPSTITVIVNNYLSELVNGASVTITGNGLTFTGTTDEQGTFVQGDLQPATYTISVADIDGFKTPEIQEIIVTEGSDNTAMITYLEKTQFKLFSEATPEEISVVSAEISANNMTSTQVAETYGWNLGDTKDITLSTGEVIQMQIIGFNHDNKSDGSGKAGITLQMKDCLATTYGMNSTNTNRGGYNNTALRTKTFATIKSTLPREWQNVIKLVDKKSANGGKTNYSQTVTSSESLFLLSEIEMFGIKTLAQDGNNEGSVYEYWDGKPNADRIKKYDANANGVADTEIEWFLRSCVSTATASFCTVGTTGEPNGKGALGSYGISFAFCV